MKIIIDAMSGDNAPGEIVKGALEARSEYGVELILVGREADIQACLGASGVPAGVSVVNAEEIIDMHDDPSTAVRRKKDASMTVALNLLRDGAGDAVISAGNTGALLAGATLLVKRIRGIRRAAMAPVIPNGGKGSLLIDCGANTDCTPEYLLQFGFMGSFYANRVLGIEHPKVGLLSNGSEDTKGTDLVRAAHALLREAGENGRITFIGNVEGSDIFTDKADVIVTDGYSGNIMLKTAEGTIRFLMRNLKQVMTSSAKTKMGALLLRDDLKGLVRTLDVKEVGGTPFLGIRRPVIKAHGNSDARAIKSAVRQAVAFVGADVTGEIEKHINDMKIHNSEGEEQ